MARTTCNCLRHRQSSSTREKQQRSWLSRLGSCENVVTMGPQQHLRAPGKRKSLKGTKACKQDPNRRDLEKCVWRVGRDLRRIFLGAEENKRTCARDHHGAKTTKHQLGRLTLPITVSRRFTDAALSYMRKTEVVPWPKEQRVPPLWQMVGHGNTREKKHREKAN